MPKLRDWANLLRLDDRLKVGADSDVAKGVIVVRTWIGAATIAYAKADQPQDLVTATELGDIAAAALAELSSIDFVWHPG